MNKVRSGFIAAVASVLATGGCASGSGGSGGAGGAMEGYPPRDNTHTRTAQFALLQAGEAEDGGESRYREALAAATTAIVQESTNPMGYMLAGQAQIGLDDYVAADTLFSKALELYPAYAEDVRIERESAWITAFNSSIDPLDEGDVAEGIRLLEKAEAIYPGQRPEALINLGMGYSRESRTEDAIDAFGRALEIIRNPRSEGVDSAMLASWAEREMSVSFNRAQMLSQAQRYDDAVAEYETYLASHPDDVTARSSMASALVEAGMPDSAQAIYDNLLSAEGLGMRDYMNIGVGLYTGEAFAQAADAFRIVTEVAPDSRDAVYNLAQALFDAEAWDELLEVGPRLIALDPYGPYNYRIYAQALVQTGDEQEAVEHLEASEALPFNLEETRLTPRAAGGGFLTGVLVNKTLEPGATVELRIHFLGEDGAAIGFADVRVVAPAADVAQAFRADFTSDETVLAFYVEVVDP